jgi:hypothetical protein
MLFSNYLKLVQWLKLAPCKGPNRVGVYVSLPEDGNLSSFLNVVLSSYLELIQWLKLALSKRLERVGVSLAYLKSETFSFRNGQIPQT